MDDTQQSRVSDAAATRKRRSSILKSQRPARTPFSELEFNVATPTDTAKSRRVSFSRRTGVAEFITNEATTTWKNFYEEHNKSLGTSSNDSDANASCQPVGHLGKRIFDQQFEEVEAVDFITSHVNGSLNNVNFTQQLASLECTADGKLTAPLNKFELSALTDQQSKLFGNDFTAPSIGENSGRINVNFSAIQQIGGDNDDLDEIQRDLERGLNGMGCHGPFSDRQNMSEYIEVELNMTHVAARNDEDMSITDTVHSPVQDVSKSASIDKKISLNNDWVADKENIVINPYAAPRESVNFAVNDEPDQILVFDGKRLTLQPDKPEKDKNYRQTLLPNSSAETPQRKTIVLNVNDDLPNFIDVMLNSKCKTSGFSGVEDAKNSEDEISTTLPVNRVDIVPKRKTIIDNTGNISMTQALSTNIICETAAICKDNSSKRRTIVFNESAGNISVTRSLPVKLFDNNMKLPERRRTVVYEDDTGNISITQAVPTNILVNENPETNEKRKTIVFEDDIANISVTQALPSNIIIEDKATDKRKTIVFNDDAGNVSITQALPANILTDKQAQEKRRTIIYEDDTGNISVTQALPTNVLISQTNEPVPERRRTVVYEDDTGNISVTQALPSNILLERIELSDYDIKNKIAKAGSVPTTQSLPTNVIVKDSDATRRRTIVYENDTGNISITQAIPTQLIPGYSGDKTNAVDVSKELDASFKKPTCHKRRTIVYDNDDDDISMTEAIPANIILSDEASKRKTIVFEEDEANISMTLAISTNVFLLDKLDSAADRSIKITEESKEVNKNVIDYEEYELEAPSPSVDAVQGNRKLIVVHSDDCDAEMSMNKTIPKLQTLIHESEKRKTVIFDNDNCNISMTKPIPAELLTFQNEMLNKSKSYQSDVMEPDHLTNPCPDVIVFQATTTSSVPKLATSITEQSDLKSDPLCSDMNSEATVTSSVKTDDVLGSAQVELDSINVSLIHPRVDERSEQLNLNPVSVAMDFDAIIGDDVEIDTKTEIKDLELIEKQNDSVLNTLLDMSASSMDSGTEDKNLMAQIESNHSSAKDTKEDTDCTSSESMFYITKDSEDDTQTDKEVENEKAKNEKQVDAPKHTQSPVLPLEFKEDEVDDLQKKLAELKTAVTEDKNVSLNRFYERIVSSDLEGVVERDENVKLKQQSITFKKANDTKELLDMISDFTDNGDEEIAGPVVGKIKGLLALENKPDVTESKRLSFAPNRQSIALSREDLLSNISMVQAALQKSRIVLDDTDSLEDTKDASMDQMIPKKSARTSNEVVKTLHFDDESMSETSMKSDAKFSPLKKTAFGETSYMNEPKGKVIPTYLKDVSDGIKELMMDLVKPMTDNMPFEAGGIDKGVRKVPSTQSTQIQANLITSSQVDIDSELYSNPEFNYEIDKISFVTGGALQKSRSRSFRSPVKFSTNSSEKSSEFEVPSPRQRYMYSRAPIEQSSPPRVLVFDHLNPLNNIHLGSMDYTDVHKYNPKKSEETLCGSERSRSALKHFDKNTKESEYEVEKVSKQYRLETRPHTMQGDACAYKQEDQNSILSNPSRPISIDQSIGAKSTELKDNEVNTLIAMKGNKELLEASSSLTLVDDALGPQSDGDADSRTTSQDTQDDESSGHHKVRSPLKTSDTTTEKKSELSLQEELLEHAKTCTKGKKRIYSPSTENYKLSRSSVDVTPKPNIKMQKLSNSPNVYKAGTLPLTEESTQMAPEKDVTQSNDHAVDQTHKTRVHDKKNSPRKKDKKPGTSVTVQQLITEYHMDSGIKQNVLDKQILDALNPRSNTSTAPASQSDVLERNSLEVVSSFTSSKNLNAMKDVHSTSTTHSHQSHPSTVQSKASCVDWHPELISAISSNLSETDSSVNVVAKIDMLPFMGSHECEWESSSVDTWSFRLLHGRLRLTARLAHRHDNATRTRVRGDTPVLDVTVETVQHDRKNPVATMCVRFACETMRYMVSRACRGTCYATDIPPLLRRCAAVARVALRWGRAMHDAKLHLAYTLDNDGYLTLKVANIPLRSVWEVTMRVELVVDDAREAPWPRAGSVRVARVVSDVSVPDADVRRALAHTPRDWGHAPRTIWRMFRYLKHKTRDDDLLLA